MVGPVMSTFRISFKPHKRGFKDKEARAPRAQHLPSGNHSIYKQLSMHYRTQSFQ